MGFKCTYKSSIKNPEYAVLEKDKSKLFIKLDSSRKAYASNIVIIETKDIEATFNEVNSKGLIVIQPISKSVWGGTEFVAKDYEDNKLVFRQNV